MPFAGFDSFAACVSQMQEKQKYDEETARKVCGKLQAEAENERKESDIDTLPARELTVELVGVVDAGSGDPQQGAVVRNVKLLGAGTWTDSRQRTPLYYSSAVLKHDAENWADRSLWSRHSGGMPRRVTEKVGEIRTPRYDPDKQAVVGDLWLHLKTQESRDTAELIKAGIVNYVSVEHGGKEVWNSAEKRYDAAEIMFGGVAVVNRGACRVCTIRASEAADPGTGSRTELQALDEEMYRILQCKDPDLPASAYAWVEDPELKTTWHLPYKNKAGNVDCACVRAAIAAVSGARTGTPMRGVPDSAKSKLRSAAKHCEIDTEFAAPDNDYKNKNKEVIMTEPKESDKSKDIEDLEHQLAEAQKTKVAQQGVEFEAAQRKLADMERENADLHRRLAEMEHGMKVRDLQRQIADLTKPVFHTVVSGASDPSLQKRMTMVELDNEEFPAYTVRDFGE